MQYIVVNIFKNSVNYHIHELKTTSSSASTVNSNICFNRLWKYGQIINVTDACMATPEKYLQKFLRPWKNKD